MTLYEITGQYLELLNMAEDEDVDAETLATTMEMIEDDFEDKADGYAKIMKELEYGAKNLAEEIKRLQARKKSLEGKRDRMETCLQSAMTACGKPKFKTELFSYSIKKNPPSLVMDVTDLDEIPPYYLVQKDPEINKAAIKEALKNGEDVGGIAHLSQGESLLIR